MQDKKHDPIYDLSHLLIHLATKEDLYRTKLEEKQELQEFKHDVNKRFDKIERKLTWLNGLIITTLIGIIVSLILHH